MKFSIILKFCGWGRCLLVSDGIMRNMSMFQDPQKLRMMEIFNEVKYGQSFLKKTNQSLCVRTHMCMCMHVHVQAFIF